MKKIIAIMLMLAMLICGCGKAENTTTDPTNATSISAESAKGTDSVTEAPTEPTEVPTEEVTEPSSEATEPSEPDEPDPYAEIKANPLSLLDMTFGEVEETYGELEHKEYIYDYTAEYYSPTLNMYFEFDVYPYTRYFDPENIDKNTPVFGVYVNELNHLNLKVGMSTNRIDNMKWDYFDIPNGSPLFLGEHPEVIFHDDFVELKPKNDATYYETYEHTIMGGKYDDDYWYTIGFKIPEEFAKLPRDSSPESGESKWVSILCDEILAKERETTLTYILVRKAGSATL